MVAGTPQFTPHICGIPNPAKYPATVAVKDNLSDIVSLMSVVSYVIGHKGH